MNISPSSSLAYSAFESRKVMQQSCEPSTLLLGEQTMVTATSFKPTDGLVYIKMN